MKKDTKKALVLFLALTIIMMALLPIAPTMFTTLADEGDGGNGQTEQTVPPTESDLTPAATATPTDVKPDPTPVQTTTTTTPTATPTPTAAVTETVAPQAPVYYWPIVPLAPEETPEPTEEPKAEKYNVTWDFESMTLEEAVSSLMKTYGLNGDNFAMGWYDITSEESYFINKDKFLPAGSMYKVPLSMIYCDMAANGEIKFTDKVGGYTVKEAMKQTLVNSSEDTANIMWQGLNTSYEDYRNKMAAYSDLDKANIPDSYFNGGNTLSPEFVINYLKHVYDDPDTYERIIDFTKQGHPVRYFKYYESEYEICHKYGYWEGQLNDSAIVFTECPFLLVAFTTNVMNGEQFLGELCQTCIQYAEYLVDHPLNAEEPTPEPTEPVAEETAKPETAKPTEAPAEAPASKPAKADSIGLKTFAILFGIGSLFTLMGAIWLTLKILAKSGNHNRHVKFPVAAIVILVIGIALVVAAIMLL